MKKTLIACLCLLVSSLTISVNAQQNQFSGWLGVFNTIKLGKKTTLLNDVQFRSTDEIQHLQTLLIRSGLQYSITNKLGLTLGYASIDNRRQLSGVSGYLMEHRIWQQLIYNHKTGPVFIQHRLRSEQRFIPAARINNNNELEKDGFGNAYRLRYFIRNIVPLKKQTGAFTEGLFASLQNEVFINTGNKSNVNGKTFDQNRLYIAGGYRINKKIDLEAGYMYQYTQGRNNTSINNHIAQIATYLRL
ncbi:DUF2490 domain-containing protein [Terrimonas sp. NA20]|uniref:DUF2490 domain-containing protein n=1 Tax=Terrimonas ginsenosidimutans TaxID=2908004 RepID=A0ABS9KPZ8_9BACT|nr:DUF2490 domain-containing protein [Terrimonas ginsenosidimutans]MCG2614398.1 DUF2490 domain-containing protein [Terrimonas ginsenosidimutans]